MPFVGASYSSNLGSPESSYDGGSGMSSLCHALPSALGSNASGSVAVAFLAILMGLMLVLPLVLVGMVFAFNDTSPGLITSIATHSMIFI